MAVSLVLLPLLSSTATFLVSAFRSLNSRSVLVSKSLALLVGPLAKCTDSTLVVANRSAEPPFFKLTWCSSLSTEMTRGLSGLGMTATATPMVVKAIATRIPHQIGKSEHEAALGGQTLDTKPRNRPTAIRLRPRDSSGDLPPLATKRLGESSTIRIAHHGWDCGGNPNTLLPPSSGAPVDEVNALLGTWGRESRLPLHSDSPCASSVER